MRSRRMRVRPAEVVIKPSGRSTDMWTRVDVELKGLDFFTMPDVAGSSRKRLLLSKCCVG